jgi:hypothetical protein
MRTTDMAGPGMELGDRRMVEKGGNWGRRLEEGTQRSFRWNCAASTVNRRTAAGAHAPLGEAGWISPSIEEKLGLGRTLAEVDRRRWFSRSQEDWRSTKGEFPRCAFSGPSGQGKGEINSNLQVRHVEPSSEG